MDITSYLLGKKAGGGGSATLQTKQVEVTSNGSQDITADTGYDGLSKVELTTNVQPTLQTKTVSITSNGTTTVSKDNDYDGMTSVSVTTNVQPNLESKSITINENTTTTVSPDSGYDGLSSVEVTTNVSGGADLSEYFIGSTTTSSTTQYVGSWMKCIKKIPNLVTPYRNNANNFFQAFNGTEIDLSSWSGLNISSATYMFNNCSNLQAVNLSGINMGYEMQGLFNNCSNLVTINMYISLENLTGANYSKTLLNAFNGCSNLENLIFGYDYGKGFTSSIDSYNAMLNFAPCPKLTHDSLISIINGLYDITSLGISAPNVKFDSTTYARLSADEIATATAKGWNIISV